MNSIYIIVLFLVMSMAVYAWLCWLFIGSIRVWICCFFPKRWRPPLDEEAGSYLSVSDLLSLEKSLFQHWLQSNGRAPALLVQLLSCPVCTAHWVAVFVCLIAFPFYVSLYPVSFASVSLLVLLGWGSAGIALSLFLKIKS